MFYEGDAADNFYIILTGTVSVLVHSQRVSGREEMRQLAVLRPGDAFGELALISNQPRMAGIMCRENSLLAYLHKDDYKRILAKIQTEVMEIKVKLLWNQQIFKHLSKIALQRLTYHFQIKHYKRKQCVFRASTDSSHLYLVKSGEFQLTKDISLSTSLSPKSSKLHIDVTLLSVGELIGAEDIVTRRPYSYTCTCHSTDGELMAINQGDFYRLVGTEETLCYLSTLSKAREQYRSSRVQSVLTHQNRLISPTNRLSLDTNRSTKDLSALNLSPRYHLNNTQSDLALSLEKSGMRASFPSKSRLKAKKPAGALWKQSVSKRTLKELSSLLRLF